MSVFGGGMGGVCAGGGKGWDGNLQTYVQVRGSGSITRVCKEKKGVRVGGGGRVVVVVSNIQDENVTTTVLCVRFFLY